MADKDKDEEKFEDDEDFGLPELHYEELDDDSESSSEEEEEKPADKPEETTQETTPDPFGEQSTSTGGEETFYEEESFDEFKEDDSSSGSVFDSDETSSPQGSFDDVSTEPSFGSDPYTESQSKQAFAAYYDDDSSKRAKSNFTKIVIIGTLLFASIAIVFVFVMDNGSLMGFGEKEEEILPPPEPVVEDTAVDSTAFQAAFEPEPVEQEPTQLTPGEITTLEQRTGKSYVVIGSFFDGDLAMDYAKVLAQNGHSPQIIPPFRDYRFYRVAIAEFNAFKEAEAQAPSYAEQFGREAWPLRY